MTLDADDYRRRAESLEKIAGETPNPVVRKSLYSIAATWRELAEHTVDPASRPLMPETLAPIWRARVRRN